MSLVVAVLVVEELGYFGVGLFENGDTAFVKEVEVRVEGVVGSVGGLEVVEEGLGKEEFSHFVDVEGGGLALFV